MLWQPFVGVFLSSHSLFHWTDPLPKKDLFFRQQAMTCQLDAKLPSFFLLPPVATSCHYSHCGIGGNDADDSYFVSCIFGPSIEIHQSMLQDTKLSTFFRGETALNVPVCPHFDLAGGLRHWQLSFFCGIVCFGWFHGSFML